MFSLYGLILGIGVYLGLLVSIKLFPKMEKDIDSAFWWAVICGVIGARLYHVIDFWDKYYRSNLEKIPVLWEGGLGIWGAVAGGVLGLVIYSRIYKKNIWRLLDAFSIGAPLAQAVGRIGNFVNGEIVGKNGEPLFAYEGLLNLVLFLYILKNVKQNYAEGKIFGIYLNGYGVIRILLENLRSEEIIWKIGGIPTAIIFSVAAVAGGLIIIGRRRS